MNLIKITNIMNILWSTYQKKNGFNKFEEKIYEISEKYASSPTMGYVLFGIIFVAAVLFINAFSKK